MTRGARHPAEQMDERHDPDAGRQRAREESLAGERLPGGFRQKQREREQGQGARGTAGGARGAERDENEEGRGQSRAPPVDEEIGRQSVHGESGAGRREPQGQDHLAPLPAALEPGAEAGQCAEVQERHPRRPVRQLARQQEPDLPRSDPDPVILQSLGAPRNAGHRQAGRGEEGRDPGQAHTGAAVYSISKVMRPER